MANAVHTLTCMRKVPNDFVPSFAFQLGNLVQLRRIHPEDNGDAFSSKSVDFLLSIRVLRQTLFLGIIRRRRDILRWEMLKLRWSVHRQRTRERKVSLSDQKDLIRRIKWDRHCFLPSLFFRRFGLFMRLGGLGNLSFLFEAGLLVE